MHRRIAGLLAALMTAGLVVACTPALGQDDDELVTVAESGTTARPTPTPSATEPATRPTTSPAAPARRGRPNIVVVMMDDFSMDLMPTMASVRQLRRRGAAVYDHFVVDSLCCVSRASLMTGQYPHQTGVRTNTGKGGLPGAGPMGGWEAFQTYGNTRRTFNLALQRSGYTTGYVGKYLNEYEYQPGVKPLPPRPPGWTQFNVVFGSAYDGWGFDSTEVADGRLRVRHHPVPPAAASNRAKDAVYAGQVVEDYSLDFIRSQRGARDPYFLLVSPYAPHNRVNAEGPWPGEPLFPPAFRDRPGGTKQHGNCGLVDCRSLTVADLPGYGDARGDNQPRTRVGKKARAWNTVRTLPRATATQRLRDRARMVQSVDRTMRKILKAVDDNTYVVFTSDNGFHLGQLGMGMGKGTAYDTDIRVPLLVVGPGVVPGRRQEMTSNIDLAATFEELAGLTPAKYRSGTSLVPTFTDRSRRTRSHVFFEHTSHVMGGDPDLAFTGGELQRIPDYVAVRSRTGLLVRHDLDSSPQRTRTAYEFYSYERHPWERTNLYGRPRYAEEVAALTARLEAFDTCRTVSGAAKVPPRCRRLTR